MSFKHINTRSSVSTWSTPNVWKQWNCQQLRQQFECGLSRSNNLNGLSKESILLVNGKGFWTVAVLHVTEVEQNNFCGVACFTSAKDDSTSVENKTLMVGIKGHQKCIKSVERQHSICFPKSSLIFFFCVAAVLGGNFMWKGLSCERRFQASAKRVQALLSNFVKILEITKVPWDFSEIAKDDCLATPAGGVWASVLSSIDDIVTTNRAASFNHNFMLFLQVLF